MNWVVNIAEVDSIVSIQKPWFSYHIH